MNALVAQICNLPYRRFQTGNAPQNSILRYGRVKLCATMCATALLLLASPNWLRAAAPADPKQIQFFESKIRPVLADNCFKCHSESEKVKGGLRVDDREALLKGGNTGPAIVPGNPEKSLLIRAILYTDPDLQMPPKDQKLTSSQIADLTAWVKMGAPFPVATASTAASKPKPAKDDHWAFKPVGKPAAPKVADPAWSANPVDAFIYASLDAKGMKPSPKADKRTLIRRVYYDMIGLPPTPAEVDAFLDDESPDAFTKLVDTLLKSPHYGERWGRHWLDTARYSDTKGEIKKKYEDETYAHAWTYRDYVIRAFNDDKPYDQFIMEQIAADRLPPGKDKSSLAALGFLTLGERFMNNMNDIIDDRIDVVTKGFLGLTVACARCHDHKFDPIPTADYYSLYGIFASSVEPKDKPLLTSYTQSAETKDYLAKYVPLQNELTKIEAMVGGRGKKGEPKAPKAKGAPRPPQLSKAEKKTLQKKESTLQGKIADLQLSHPGAPPQAMVLVDKPNPADAPIFIRGESQSKGAVVPRQFLDVLSNGQRKPFRNGSGRLELAQAIASKDNPLTARVMVNRIWQHHFGVGFVPTPDDLGHQSDPPSHPELLDYLSRYFMEHGWSVKEMHRLILLSNTWQQDSKDNPRYSQVDPFNRLLWRQNIRRLDFEALRDGILAIGGSLDATVYGKPVKLEQEPYSNRRTLYGFVDRNNLSEILNSFDFANPDMTSGRRNETTVPQQSLFLMNSPMVVEQAKKLVKLPEFTELDDDKERIEFLFERIYQRPPTPVDLRVALNFLGTPPALAEQLAQKAPPPEVSRRKRVAKKSPRKGPANGATAFVQRAPLSSMEEFAHALFMANEMSFVN